VKRFLFRVLFVSILLFGTSISVFPQGEETRKEGPAAEVPANEVKEIEQKAAETERVIEKKVEDAGKAKKEAEKILAEKQVIEKEAQLKEQAALIAKQELEVVKKEAEITADPEAKKRARKMAEHAKQLEREAVVYQEKLTVAESKAKMAEEAAAAQERWIEAMRKELQEFKREKASQRNWVQKSVGIVVGVLLGLVFFFLMNFGLKRLEQSVRRKDVIRESAAVLRFRTLVKLGRWLGGVVIVGAMIYIVLENFGIDVTPLLAGAGIVGFAFGFGGQYLIRDIINGIFILLEGQYRVDDVVKIGEHGGLVEDINLRTTILRDLEGRVIVIPNGEIKTVVNFTKGFSYALLDIGVAYKENVDRVIEVIREIGRGMREDPPFARLILADLEMFGVDQFADSQVTIKFRIKTLPIKQWEVAREFRRRLKNRFDELGIEIPFPHRTLYWGTGPDNEWLREWACRRTPVK